MGDVTLGTPPPPITNLASPLIPHHEDSDASGGPWPYPSLTAVQVSDFREVSGALDQKSKSLSVGNSVKFQLQFTGPQRGLQNPPGGSRL